MSTLAHDMVLPPVVVSRADLARLAREIETVDGDLEAQKVRGLNKPGKTAYHLPAMSQALSDFLDVNKLDVADDQTRMSAKEQLRKLKDTAPVVHMTFAVQADPESLQQLVGWLRTNTHPQALLSTGLQPALVGGVYLRTPNHVHDFSMRALFANSRDILTREIEGLAA